MQTTLTQVKPDEPAETKVFEYSRKYSIKDLFSLPEIYGTFETVDFRNLKAFINFLQKGLLPAPVEDTEKPTYEYVLNLFSPEEVDMAYQLLSSTQIYSHAWTTLYLRNAETVARAVDVLDEKLKNCNVKIAFADMPKFNELLLNPDARIRRLLANSLIWVQVRLTPETLNNDYEDLFTVMLNCPRAAFIDLTVDYAAWETQPISDLHRLFFFCGTIQNWLKQQMPYDPWVLENDKVVVDTKNTRTHTFQLKRKMTCLKASLDENLDIFLSPWDDKPYFQISKFVKHTGETIPLRALMRLRQILDVRFKKARFSNMYFLDLSQNLKIMGDPFMIPHLTNLVGEWLEAQNDRVYH